MSNTISHPLPDIDPALGLMFSVADQLIPLFSVGSIDPPFAHRMAITAIEAYEPETPADFVNVARTIAFSMSAVALLGHAAAKDLTMPEKLRAFSRANALNRSADQSERTMMQRRRYQKANSPTEQPVEPPAQEPDVDHAAVHAAVAEAMDVYAATRGSTKAGPAATDTAPVAARATTAPGPAPVVTRAQPPIAAPASAIHYTGAGRPVTIPVRGTQHKQELLRHSAMPRVAGGDGLPHHG
jgi:hypothetical protein